MDTPVCCFGLRDKGCIYANPEMEYHLKTLAQVEMQLVEAKYEADPWWAAETRNDRIDFPEMNNIIDPVMEKIAKITGKVYNFVYKGHEYTHNDNSMDFKSCPHCDSEDKSEIGYYGSGQDRIICFECNKCFEKFYYHSPEVIL
jgi:uncharacterized protein YggL (DUF469 family)